MQQAPERTVRLPSGASFSYATAPALAHIWSCTRERSVMRTIAHGSVLIITVHDDKRWSEVVHEVFSHEQARTFPLTFHLAGALLLAGSGRLPDEAALMIAGTITSTLQPFFSVGAASDVADVALEATILQALQPRQETLQLPEGHWDLARWCVRFGLRLWELHGVQARACGTRHWRDSGGWFEHLRSQCAGLVVPLVRHKRSALAVDETTAGRLRDRVRMRSEAWLDYIALAAGPLREETVPVVLPGGLGTGLHQDLNPNTTPPMELGRAEVLRRLADALLHKPDRPTPRHLHRPLNVVVPHLLRPVLAPYGLMRLTIIPELDGLFIAAYNASGQQLGAAWWGATSSSADYAPLALSPAAWTALHIVLAALWHDLCANAIKVSEPRHQNPMRSERVSKRSKRKTTQIRLPPIVYEAAWSSEEEQRLIEAYVQRPGRYRLLPGGWMERSTQRAFQRRQEAAAARAVAENWDPPPPGFTFVKRHFRPGSPGDAPVEARPQVVSRALMSVALGVGVELGDLELRDDEIDDISG